MTRQELKTVYVEAAIRARTKPQKSEEDLWFKEFEYATVRDLTTAIAEHFKQSEWMPKESGLKPLVDQAQRARVLAVSTEKLLVRRKCELCGIPTSGFNEPNDLRKRYCQAIPRRPHVFGEVCGGDMIETHRASYSSGKGR